MNVHLSEIIFNGLIPSALIREQARLPRFLLLSFLFCLGTKRRIFPLLSQWGIYIHVQPSLCPWVLIHFLATPILFLSLNLILGIFY